MATVPPLPAGFTLDQPIGPPDFTTRYNTPLNPAAEARFRAAFPNTRDLYDYDLRGYFQKHGAVRGEGHLTDEFKKPNHPTFSTESKYSGTDNYAGGEWQQQPDDSWVFAASPTNLQMSSPEGLEQYFAKVEPGNKLVLPAQSAVGQPPSLPPGFTLDPPVPSGFTLDHPAVTRQHVRARSTMADFPSPMGLPQPRIDAPPYTPPLAAPLARIGGDVSSAVAPIWQQPLGLPPAMAQRVRSGPMGGFNDIFVNGPAAALDLVNRGLQTIPAAGIAGAEATTREIAGPQAAENVGGALTQLSQMPLFAAEMPTGFPRVPRTTALETPPATAARGVVADVPRPTIAPGESPVGPSVPSAAPAGFTEHVIPSRDPLQIGTAATGVAAPKEMVPLTEPRIEGTVSKKVVDAASELLVAGKVQRDPNRLISDQIAELLQTSRLSTPEIDAVLTRHGVKPVELADLWRVNIYKAARDMQTLSAVEQRLKALTREPGAEADLAAMQDSNGLDSNARAMGFWRRLDGVRRGLLVTQLATAARNFTSQVGRLGLDVLQQGMDATLGKMFGAPGAANVSPFSAFEGLLNVFRPIATKVKVDDILSRFPAEQDALFNRYASDLSRKSGGGIMGGAEKAVTILNTANRFQEFVVRRAVFAASLDRHVARAGQDLGQLIAQNKVGTIPRDTIARAVHDALEVTWSQNFSPFAKGAEGTAGAFIRLFNRPPFSLAVPFPRFLMNAVKFQYQFSPAGFLRLLSKSERDAIANGNYSAITRATIGTGLLLAAYQLRTSQYAGEKWYEIRLPSGRTLDARAFAPFSAYLFMADIINPNRRQALTTRDVAQGILSANLRAGVGLYAVDQVLNGIGGIGDPEKAKRLLQTGAGEILSGFLTPLQQIRDVVAQFDQQEGVVRSGDEGPIAGINWGPVVRQIPFASQSLPAVESPTRSADLNRESPLLRQLTGVTLSAPKNPAERELDRLGVTRAEILPGQGDAKADRLVAQYMGPLVERVIVPFVQGPKYQAMSDPLRALTLSRMLQSVRDNARKQAETADPALFARLKQQSIPRRKQDVIKQLGAPQ